MGLTNSTVKTYLSALNKLFQYTGKEENFELKEIEEYLDYLIIKKNYKASSRNLVAKSIQFYLREFQDIEIELRMAKQVKAIPKVCWDNQFTQIISATPNIKHRLLLQLYRYSGLRKVEGIKIMKFHILDDARVLVKGGKGQKDRYTITPPQIHDQFKSYISLLPADNPYIFQGQKSLYYSDRTPQAILNNAFKKLGWHKEQWFGCHALRHAFTIWALDNKIGDFDEVSKWLGHSVKQTTQIYTQCRKLNLQSAIERCKAIPIIQ